MLLSKIIDGDVAVRSKGSRREVLGTVYLNEYLRGHGPGRQEGDLGEVLRR